ncbi:hypothetical protein BBJ28_00018739 [Nothophytophthora sp. Chile5]|nr:hypothetical protein BBJ28_00018739 [Nothophytophthora sp. Chile5]
MPFRSLRPEERGAALAAPLSAAAREFYSAKQSSTYTTAANASIQKDLTRHALELLQLRPEAATSTGQDVFFLLDLGAGSGLSTTAASDWLQEREELSLTLAFDISTSMLSLALQGTKNEGDNPQQCVDLYCGNAAQRLPLRGGSFNAAIGVSMLQWLQPEGLEICFTSLLATLSRGCDSSAVFQVYPPSLEYVDIMEQTALRVGFHRAEMFVSFPHSTTAKKWFLSLEKKQQSCDSTDGQAAGRVATLRKQEVCLFARRYHRRCVLQWLGVERDSAKEIRERVEKEHVKTAWHIWRKYRRAYVDAAAVPLNSSVADARALHAKAKQSLELYTSDRVIGRALQTQFQAIDGGIDQISLAFLLQRSAEVVDVLHSVHAGFASVGTGVTIGPLVSDAFCSFLPQAYTAATEIEHQEEVARTAEATQV